MTVGREQLANIAESPISPQPAAVADVTIFSSLPIAHGAGYSAAMEICCRPAFRQGARRVA
ncbi:MAG: hypothetical protein IPI44_02130 [Sulfuritalea sp.]|nr:hypothetical protein [Sulfuritalea sp.]